MFDEKLRREICAGFSIEPIGDAEALVRAPLYLDGGDQCSVVVRTADAGYRLSDDGESFGRAFDYGVDLTTGERRRAIEASLAAHGVMLNEDAIETTAEPGQLSDAVFRMYQASWEVVRMSAPPKLAPPEAPERRLEKQLRRLLRKVVPADRIKEDWIDPRDSKRQVYPATFFIEAAKPLLIFGVTNTASCLRSTISCMHYKYQRRPGKYRRIAVYDESATVTHRGASQLNEVTERHFKMPTDREELDSFVASAL